MRAAPLRKFTVSPDFDQGDIPTPKCIKLLTAVLFRAFQDLSVPERHIRRQSAGWFSDTTSRAPMSLYNICAYLDLNHLTVSDLAKDTKRIKSITQSLWRKN